MALTVNEGTQTNVYSIENAGTEIPYVKLDAGVGSAVQDWGGTIPTVANLTNGTVRVSVGTIATGTLQNLVTGTINALASGTITGGTLQNIVGGTIGEITTVSNLTNGTTRISFGTITTGTLQNLVSGTVNALASGTITAGTVLTYGNRHADEFATVITSGTSTLGTIKAAVSGSAIYVTGLIISVQAPSNVEIASGGTSTLITGSFFFAGSGGAALLPLDPPLRTASGSALVYKQSANTGLSITAIGYVD